MRWCGAAVKCKDNLKQVFVSDIRVWTDQNQTSKPAGKMIFCILYVWTSKRGNSYPSRLVDRDACEVLRARPWWHHIKPVLLSDLWSDKTHDERSVNGDFKTTQSSNVKDWEVKLCSMRHGAAQTERSQTHFVPLLQNLAGVRVERDELIGVLDPDRGSRVLCFHPL